MDSNPVIAKLICWWRGHKRGKRTAGTGVLGTHEFRCPRCGALWYRKVRT